MPVVRSPVLVGRDAELAAATRLVGASGGPDRIDVLLVEGAGGVGKTRLVAEAMRAVPPGTTVVFGAAYAGAGDVPLLPWAEALRDLLRQWGVDAVADAAGTAAPDFAVLLPELGALGDATGTRVPDLMPWLWEQLAARAPLVVVLEDMHAADPGSIGVLQRLSRHGRGGLCLVVTARQGGDSRDPEGARRWQDAAAELRRSAHTTIALEPLPPSAAGELAGYLVAGQRLHRSGRRPAPEIVQSLAEASGGLPFVLEQLAAAHLDGRPVDVVPGDPATASLPRLSAPALDLLNALVVNAAEADHELLQELVPGSEPELTAALRETVDAGVVVLRADGRYAVAHALVAEQARARLLPIERRRWHAVIARALSERPEDARAVAALPAHCEAAGDAPGALVASVRAGGAASYVPGVAARHFARAVAIWGTVDDAETLTGTTYDELVERAATGSALAGDVDAAVELARRWLDGDGPLADPARASRMALLIASRGEWTLPAAQVQEAFAAAVRYAEVAHGSNLSAALTGQARHLAALDRNEEAEPLARKALQLASDDASEVAYASATLGAILAHLGDHDGGAAQLRVALERLDPLDNSQEHARTMFELVWTEFYAGRAVVARDLALETVRALGGAGLVFDIRASLLGAAAQIEAWLGRWPEAELLLERGEREDPAGMGHASRLLAAGEVALRSGRVLPARALIAQYLDHWEALGLREFDHVGLNISAEAAVADGDLDVALDLLREGLASIRAADTIYEISVFARGGALVLAAAARAGYAPAAELGAGVADAVDTVSRCTRLSRSSVPAADLLTARAALADSRGQPSSALWSAAADAWAELGFPWWENTCRLSYAEALLRSRGARASAAPIVAAVRAAAERLGARGLVADADRLAASAGLAREPAGGPSGPAADLRADPSGADPLAGLTAREREVLALLVEGLSNRQVAARLFISEKTASVHVSNILAKLGVTSRLQAAALAHGRLGPDAAGAAPG